MSFWCLIVIHEFLLFWIELRVFSFFFFLFQFHKNQFTSSNTGPKTVFFWAPITKWGLVIAGLADMTRPAEKLSTGQSAVLTATGLIWSRYSLVIIPKNWSLFAVNFFVGCAGGSQLFRIWSLQ
ncbi:mitochondrial pyruvate carrier 2-like isoform X1 [Xenopus laevis]|uniref:Mitochondrial pyruvate carrier n=1 Tax=Xenopus laevis TaxID=8355 RepID=A0A8J1M9B0_XENLA|nr:mitochondrial pyruvate carrier 2-like isoform X1 [Xenopus laevis]